MYIFYCDDYLQFIPVVLAPLSYSQIIICEFVFTCNILNWLVLVISIAPDQFESELGSAFNTDLYFCYQVFFFFYLYPSRLLFIFHCCLSFAISQGAYFCYQVIIAQWLAWQLAIGQLTIGGVLRSNLSKGDNLVEFWLKRKILLFWILIPSSYCGYMNKLD